MNVRQVNVLTDAAGAFAVNVKITGEIMAIGVVIGTLSTPDVAITDLLTGKSIFAKTGIAADASYQPRVVQQDAVGADNAELAPIVCYGTAHVAIAGGGATLAGKIYIAYRG